MADKKPFTIICVTINRFEDAGITTEMLEKLQTEYNIHLVRQAANNEIPKKNIVGYLEISQEGNTLTLNKQINASASEILAVLNK